MDYSFTTFINDYIIADDRLPFVLSVILLSSVAGFVFGPVFGRLNPPYWAILELFFSKPADKLNRRHRPLADLMLRGFLLMVFVGGVSMALGVYFNIQDISELFGGIGLVLVLLPVFSGGAVWRMMLSLYKELGSADSGADGHNRRRGIYYALSKSTRFNLSSTDDYTITRLGIVYMVNSFNKGMVAPAFWFVVGGLPGVYLYSAVSFMKWRVGREGHSKAFGVVAEKSEKIMGIVPSYFAAILLVLASLFTPTIGVVRALRGLLACKKGQYCLYPQGGRPATVIAWAMRISLGGGLVDYDGLNIKSDWAGPPDSSARLDRNHLRRAIYLLVVGMLICAMMLLAAILAIYA